MGNAGDVSAVEVVPGQPVVAGAVIAHLDDREQRQTVARFSHAFQAQLRNHLLAPAGAQADGALRTGAAAAAGRQADIDVRDARRKLALETQSYADGLSARAALDEANLEVERARAAAAKAAASIAAEASHVQAARERVANTELRAPTSGTVAMRFVDPGAMVVAGTPIVRIVGDGKLRLRFAAPPDAAARLRPGNRVRAAIGTISTPVAATIREVARNVDPASGMIIVEAELVGDPVGPRPGLAAWVRCITCDVDVARDSAISATEAAEAPSPPRAASAASSTR